MAYPRKSEALGLPLRLEHAHPPTSKQKGKKHELFVLMGESMDLGNTFWQAHIAKNKKAYLG